VRTLSVLRDTLGLRFVSSTPQAQFFLNFKLDFSTQFFFYKFDPNATRIVKKCLRCASGVLEVNLKLPQAHFDFLKKFNRIFKKS